MNFKNTKIKLLDLDLKGCLYLNQLSHTQNVSLFFQIVSRLGDGVFWYLMLAAVWAMQGFYFVTKVLYILVGGLFGTLIYKILKTKTVRPRPYQVHQVIRLGERPLDHFSFPSGHTLHAVMVTTVLGYIEPVMLFLMLPFTLLVAVSRMVLGLHYPSDVAVGALIGGTVASLIIMCAPVFGFIL
jgi:undecaprenyl-diphosphatase